jgi:hypothetical protein
MGRIILEKDLQKAHTIKVNTKDWHDITKAKGKMSYGNFYVFCCKSYIDSLLKK